MLDPNAKRNFKLYVLKLEHEKYYVGITAQKDWQDRIKQHEHGFYTAQWVKKHPLVATIKVKELGYISKLQAEQLETEETWLLMREYGYQNVRGGRFSYSGRYIKIGSVLRRDKELGTALIGLLLIALALALWSKLA